VLELASGVSEPFGQGWTQVAEFAVALLLSGAIGLEREIRQKAAGLRTYTTVGVGAAAAAGLPLLALLATAAYFAVSYAVRPLTHRLPSLRAVPATYRITYLQGTGLLRELLDQCTRDGFFVSELRTIAVTSSDPEADPGLDPDPDDAGRHRVGGGGPERTVEIALAVQGRGDADALTAHLAGVDGVLACRRSSLDDE